MDQMCNPATSRETVLAGGMGGDPFAAAVRATRMPIVISDPRQADCPVVFCNDAFLALTGYARDEVVGRNCRFLQGPGTDPGAVARLREGLSRREPVQVDILNYRKDGTSFWNALSVSPVFEGGELVHYTASQVDVSAAKRAEEHRFLLNRELDHRVKNTLATVQTVVLQTLKAGAATREMAAAVTGRLQAIARSHDVLTEEAWASALVADVVEGALAPARERAGGRVEVSGPDVRLKPRAATMLSLAVHELADNALRHGSLTAGTGTVSVLWRVEGGRFRLEWHEAGGPFVFPPERAGFGMRIVERVLAAEFGGTARIDFAPAGVSVALDAPADGLDVEKTRWSAP